MKGTFFIWPEQRGQISGSISYTRLMSMAQLWLARLRTGTDAASTAEAAPGCSAAAAAACLRRRRRALFEYQPRQAERAAGHVPVLEKDQAYVMVAVLDERGSIVPGFEAEKCVIRNEDRRDVPLQWGEASARRLAGTAVRLRISLRSANVYALTSAPP